MAPTLGFFVYLLAQVLFWAILLRALMSWMPGAHGNPIYRVAVEITEPILAPLRRVVPLIGMIDVTPMIAMIILQVIAQAVGGHSIGF